MKGLSGNRVNRIEGASLLRVLGGIAIVLLHTVNISEILWRDQLTLGQERLSMITVYSLMWAVPVFFMVSGALLLNPQKEISVSKIYKTYVLRIVLALAAFVFIFRVFDLIMNGESFSTSLLIEIVYKFISDNSWSHLWYLYILIGLYILLPLYRMIAKACDDKSFNYLFISGFVFLSLIPTIESTLFQIGFKIQISAIYSLYFFAGYGISSGKLRIPRKWGLLMFVTGNVINIILSIINWKMPVSGIEDVLSSYASPAVVIESLGLFAMLWDWKLSEQSNTVISILDEAGFGVYLIHMIPLRYILKYSGINPYEGGWAVFVFIWAGCYATAVLITAVLRRIPVGRRIL